MQNARRFGATFGMIGLRLVIIAVAVTSTLTIVFGTPNHLKAALKNSHIYDRLVSSIITSTMNDDKRTDVPLDRPEIKAAAEAAFTPQYLETSANSIIDGSYRWLDGTTPQPKFSVDTQTPKTQFANAVADYADQRFASLPVCTSPSQVRQGFDIFTITCRPPGVNIAAEKQRLVDEMLSNQEFLGDGQVTSDDLPKNEQGQTITEQLQVAPKVFQLSTKAPLILGILAVVLAAVMVLMHRNKRLGLTRVAFAVFSSGLLIALIGGVFWLVTRQANISTNGGGFNGVTVAEFNIALLAIFRELSVQVSRTLLIHGAAIFGFGLLLHLVIKLHKPQAPGLPTPPTTPTESTVVSSSEAPPTSVFPPETPHSPPETIDTNT